MVAVAETLAVRWRRRALTIAGFSLAAILFVVLLPLTLSISCLVDVLGRRRFASTRALLALGLYVLCEAAGLVASLVVWVRWGRRGRGAEFAAANYRLQSVWARTLLRGAMRLYGMRGQFDGGENALAHGPFLLFVRHASTVDTLLAANFVAPDRPYRLRYVIKRELLWDPCLDIVGQRIPNVFIRRGRGGGEQEVAAIRALARDLGPEDGVLIYPEGTRRTAAKHARAMARITAADPERAARVAELAHVLPPRYGGPLGLIEERPDVDVVFLAHVGFEDVESLNHLWTGALIGRDVRVAVWRVAAAAIPRERREREIWLDREWQRVDDWVGARQPAAPGEAEADRLA